MKRTIMDGILFFLAMNFLGILTAIGIMFLLGKLNADKLKDLRSIALDEAVLIKPEKIKEYNALQENYTKLKKDVDHRTKNEGLSNSSIYDNQILALQKREIELKNYDSQIKTESQEALKRWNQVNSMLEEIKKRQEGYAQEKKDDQERSKDDKLKILLKRYDTMEAANVGMALINSKVDPKTISPLSNGKDEDIRVKEAAFYLKEMKPARAAEIMETMGPLWTNALQKYMEKMPIADNNLNNSK